MIAVILVILLVVFFALLFVVFRPPAPRLVQLFAFVALLIVGVILVYLLALKAFDFKPEPWRFRIANWLTDNRMIDLTQFVPGLREEFGLIQRIDTDGEDAEPIVNSTEKEKIEDEWLVFYQYDTTTTVRTGNPPRGPYGAAIYDVDRCRPPAVQSFELVPVNYDYLGQDGLSGVVEEIIPEPEVISRPEVIIAGYTSGVVTDLNIFRKKGAEPDCSYGQTWRDKGMGGQACPYPVSYPVIGSFRGNYLVQRDGSTVNVYDRAGFERSQIVLRRQFKPQDNGTYFSKPVSQTLASPAQFGLEFGPGWPDNIPQVYYPEKAVLAFYLSLTGEKKDLERAKSYLSDAAQKEYNINNEPFGIYMPRTEMNHALVWEIRYDPDVEEERAHKDRLITVVVVGAGADGPGQAHPCQVTWRVIGVTAPGAMPYGCEWRLDNYKVQDECPPPGEHGELDDDRQVLGLVAH